MLTEKEIDVLRLRKANLTQVEVAKKLSISQAAVSVFEKNAIKKINEAQQMLVFAGQMKIKGGKNGKA